MKKTFLVLAKLALGGLFLYNIGLFNLRFPDLKEKDFDSVKQSELTDFIKEKVNAAEAEGTAYSPDMYFDDMIAIDMKFKSLPGTYKENFLINQLFYSSLENKNKGFFTDKQTEVAANRYKRYIDPEQEYREELSDRIKRCGLGNMLKDFLSSKLFPWLFNFYLKNFLLGLILIWIWWYQKYETWRIKNPVGFIVSVIGYPYLIGKTWREYLRRGVRYVSYEVELRKTKTNFFSLLSDDEIGDLRRFTKSRLKMGDWKKYLRNQGLSAKRSLASALLATILFSFFSIICSGSVLDPEKHFSGAKVAIEQSDQGPPDPSDVTLDLGAQNSTVFYLDNRDYLESLQIIARQDDGHTIFEKNLLYYFQFYQKIKHIPISVDYIR